MIKYTFVFLLTSALFFIPCDCFSQLPFQKAYGGINDDVTADMIRCTDGNYIIAGTSFNLNGLYYDAHLVKVDTNGVVLWDHVYQAPLAEAVYSVIETFDHGFAIVLSTNSFDSTTTTQEVCLIRTNSTGNFQWASAYRFSIGEIPKQIIETSDHGFLVVGETTPPGGPGSSFTDGLAIKTDAAGTMEWMKSYGGADHDIYFSASQLSDHGFLFYGKSKSFPGPVYKMLLTRTDSAGNEKWSKVYDGAVNETGLRIISVTDSEYVLAGSTGSSGNIDGALMKVDTSGAFKWAKSYGGVQLDMIYSGAILSDNGFLLTGFTLSFIFGNTWPDAYALRTDGVGNLAWSYHYGGLQTEEGISILPANDNGAIIAAYTNSFGIGNEDFYLIKTDSTGNSTCHNAPAATVVSSYITTDSLVALTIAPGGIPTYELLFNDTASIATDTLCFIAAGITGIKSQPASLIVFPNPSTGNFEISFPDSNNRNEIFIYDATGRLVEKRFHDSGLTENFNLNLSGGFYFLKVITNGYISGYKIMVNR